MQIHNLNTLNGNLDGNAFVVVDNGVDTGKVAVPNLTKSVEEAIEQVNERVDNIIAGGTAPSEAEVTDARLGIYGLYSSLGNAVRGQAEQLQGDIDQIAKSFASVEPYLYKRNAYIHYSTGAITDISGYSIYKIPVSELDVIAAEWSATEYWGALGGDYGKIIEFTDETFAPLKGELSYGLASPGTHKFLMVGINTIANLYLNVKDEYKDTITLYINTPYTRLSNDVITSKELLDNNTITSLTYMTNTNFGLFSSPYRNYYVRAKAGDIIRFNKTVPGVSGHGAYIINDATKTKITTSEFVAPADCVVCIYDKTDVAGEFIYIPINSIKIAARDIIGDIGQSQFSGMDGVAFGTSLTSRSINNDGYLDYLPTLSGVTFDNQGIGSSYILGNMLTAIKNYASYSDKQICLLEGFVNDWYNNKTLGTWKDSGETTVCGCVRSAINYIMSQNADITLFLILDHYGRNYSGVDCSTTAVNGAGLTQYEYYSEIAKVAESLGIPVIKEFEDSGISENTPQYLLDNIHCNALGAIQSAYAIWYQMKQYPANQV